MLFSSRPGRPPLPALDARNHSVRVPCNAIHDLCHTRHDRSIPALPFGRPPSLHSPTKNGSVSPSQPSACSLFTRPCLRTPSRTGTLLATYRLDDWNPGNGMVTFTLRSWQQRCACRAFIGFGSSCLDWFKLRSHAEFGRYGVPGHVGVRAVTWPTSQVERRSVRCLVETKREY